MNNIDFEQLIKEHIKEVKRTHKRNNKRGEDFQKNLIEQEKFIKEQCKKNGYYS